MQHPENKMGVLPVTGLVVKLSLPIMVSMVVQSMYNIVDSIFVARLSEAALTATSIAYSAQLLQITAAVGTGVGINAIVSRHLGAKEFDKANEAASTGLILTLLTSGLFILWGVFWTEGFIRLFVSDDAIVNDAVIYLRICQVWSSGIFLATFTQRLLQSTGKTFLSMMAQIAGALTNLILDPIMIFGLLGCPAMGIAGAAIATVIGQWVSALAGFVFNYIQNKEISITLKHYRMHKQIVKEIYKIGVPTIISQSFTSITVAAMNFALAPFSMTAVAFFGVYFKLQSFLTMQLNGLGQVSLSIVSYNYGAGKRERVLQACRAATTFAVSIALAGACLLMFLPSQLLGMFSAGQDMLTLGVPALRIIAPSLVPAAVTMTAGYIVSGLGDGFVNMFASALRQLIVLIPCVMVLGRLGGVSFVWYAFWIAEGCALAYAVVKLSRELRTKI